MNGNPRSTLVAPAWPPDYKTARGTYYRTRPDGTIWAWNEDVGELLGHGYAYPDPATSSGVSAAGLRAEDGRSAWADPPPLPVHQPYQPWGFALAASAPPALAPALPEPLTEDAAALEITPVEEEGVDEDGVDDAPAPAEEATAPRRARKVNG